MWIRYSAFSSTLLLPPSCTPESSSRGDMERMSKPRMLYSPPRKIFWKIGSVVVLPYGRMYSVATRKPNDVRFVWGMYQIPSTRGLRKLVLPPSPATSIDTVYRRPLVGKIGLSTVL